MASSAVFLKDLGPVYLLFGLQVLNNLETKPSNRAQVPSIKQLPQLPGRSLRRRFSLSVYFEALAALVCEYGGFPKLGIPFGVFIIRMIIFWG